MKVNPGESSENLVCIYINISAYTLGLCMGINSQKDLGPNRERNIMLDWIKSADISAFICILNLMG